MGLPTKWVGSQLRPIRFLPIWTGRSFGSMQDFCGEFRSFNTLNCLVNLVLPRVVASFNGLKMNCSGVYRLQGFRSSRRHHMVQMPSVQGHRCPSTRDTWSYALFHRRLFLENTQWLSKKAFEAGGVRWCHSNYCIVFFAAMLDDLNAAWSKRL